MFSFKKKRSVIPEAIELIDRGIELVESGKIKKAIKYFDKAIKIEPGRAEFWLAKGSALELLKNRDKAIECYEEAITIDPKITEAWAHKGLCLGILGQNEEAIKCLDNAIELNPVDADSWGYKGAVLTELNRFDEAIECYDKAIKSDPDIAGAWGGKGLVLGRQGRYQEALECEDKALELDPELEQAKRVKEICIEELKKLGINIKENYFLNNKEGLRWQIGDKIQGRYEVTDVKGGPGKSGMGIVYIATDQLLYPLVSTIPDREARYESEKKFGSGRFAIKTFQNRFLRDKDTINRFIQEAEVWIKLGEHDNIVRAHYVQKIEGKPYIFLEYIDGGDITRWVGKITVHQALDFAIQFCTGMDYAYKKLRIIHRDIKPGNILIAKDKIVKITDFGLASALPGRTEKLHLILHGSPAVSSGRGTLLYMPPEQFSEDIQRQFSFKPRPVTIRTDIYSFGVTFYYLLTERLPTGTPGDSDYKIISRIFNENPISPMQVSNDIPRKLDQLIMKCLEKDPKDRYKDFKELRKNLKEIQKG